MELPISNIVPRKRTLFFQRVFLLGFYIPDTAMQARIASGTARVDVATTSLPLSQEIRSQLFDRRGDVVNTGILKAVTRSA